LRSLSRIALSLLVAAALRAPAMAAPASTPAPAPAVAKSSDIALPVEEFTLANGMKFIVVGRHDVPTVAAYIQYRVGSASERPGITGGSHLLEHMMFKGTERTGTWNHAAEQPIMKQIDALAAEMIAEQAKLATAYGGGDPKRVAALKDQIKSLQGEQKKYMLSEELWGTYLRNGGVGLNASTWEDGTNYYLNLPANRLEVWAYLESDRMANPVFREFYTERDVVMEERRMSVDNDPGGKLFEALEITEFSSLPYHWPVIGWPSDLESMRREDMEAYFKTFYAPNNAVAVVVGDVTVDQVKALAEKYFASIPSSTLPVTVPTREAEPPGQRRVAVEYDAQPQMIMAFHGPRFGDEDEFALDVVAEILSRGLTSRLYGELVDKRGLAASAYAFNYTRRLGNSFVVGATPRGKHTAAELEKALWEQLDLLKTKPVQAWELQKVVNGLEADFIRGLASNMGLANRLGNAEALSGTWRTYDQRDRWRAVTPTKIMQVARQYFTRKNSTVATLIKPQKAGR